jgi:hypothetical protein
MEKGLDIRTLDKTKVVELNAIETQLEIACDYELKGEKVKSKEHLYIALWFDALAHGLDPDKWQLWTDDEVLESDND